MMERKTNTAGTGVVRSEDAWWAAYEALPSQIRSLMQNAGLNFDPVLALEVYKSYRDGGKPMAEIVALFVERFSAATSKVYRESQ